ncbi:MAG: hypothetical protein ABI877_00595 [Gemmatimonadaceae bacterium]
MLPIILVQAYLNLTLFVFAFGPWEYPVSDLSRVVNYVLLAHLALFLGYLWGVRGRGGAYRGHLKVNRLLRIASFVTLLMILPTSLLNTGKLVPDVLFGLQNPGEAYAIYQEARIASTPVAAYFRMLIGPLLALPLPLTAFYWGSLRRSSKILGLSAVLGNMALNVAMGVNQGVTLPIVLAPFFILVAILARRTRPTKGQWVGIVAGSMLAIAGALTFFTSTATERSGSGAASGTFIQIGAAADRENFLVRGLPDAAVIGVFGLTGYLGQGYYGLSLAMDKPFIPMYGIGHSTFLYRQAVRITGNEELAHLAYPERISDEDGWTAVQFFQTIYPWFASDVGFGGAIFVVGLIGCLFGSAYRDALRGDNPYAVGFLGQLFVMLLYFPALNAVLQGGEGLAAFWGLCIAWRVTRRRWVVERRVVPIPAINEGA